MIEIDLLKFFDKSFSEIDELLHSKQSINNAEEEKEELTSVIKEKKKKSSVLVYLTAAALFIIVGFTGYKFYELIKSNLVTLPQQETENKEAQAPPTQPEEIPKDKSIITENTMNEEDIVIGTIEFVNENITPVPLVNTSLDNKSTVPLQDKTESKIAVADKEPQKPEPIKATYTLKLYYVNNQTLNSIKKKLQHYPDYKLKILGKNSKTKTKWFLYKPTKGTNQFIGSREVAFIRSFDSKEEAIAYAKRNNMPAIIVKKSEREISYDITINNFKSSNEAYNFIKNFNINSKHIGVEKS